MRPFATIGNRNRSDCLDTRWIRFNIGIPIRPGDFMSCVYVYIFCSSTYQKTAQHHLISFFLDSCYPLVNSRYPSFRKMMNTDLGKLGVTFVSPSNLTGSFIKNTPQKKVDTWTKWPPQAMACDGPIEGT